MLCVNKLKTIMDTNTAHVISQQVLESTAQDMTGKYVWMFVAGLVILMFKSSIEKLAAALFMFIGSDYKEDDVQKLYFSYMT
jgi:hypothetical protein